MQAKTSTCIWRLYSYSHSHIKWKHWHKKVFMNTSLFSENNTKCLFISNFNYNDWCQTLDYRSNFNCKDWCQILIADFIQSVKLVASTDIQVIVLVKMLSFNLRLSWWWWWRQIEKGTGDKMIKRYVQVVFLNNCLSRQ